MKPKICSTSDNKLISLAGVSVIVAVDVVIIEVITELIFSNEAVMVVANVDIKVFVTISVGMVIVVMNVPALILHQFFTPSYIIFFLDIININYYKQYLQQSLSLTDILFISTISFL